MSSDMTTTETLESLADKINTEHIRTVEHAGKAIEHACRAGEWLLKAKAQVTHGEWLPWLQANVQFSQRTAQGYIRVSKNLPKLEEKRNAVADLSLRNALKALASPVLDGSIESENEAHADMCEAIQRCVDAGDAHDTLLRTVKQEHLNLIAVFLKIKEEVEDKRLDWTALRDPSDAISVFFDFAFSVDKHMDPMGDHFMEIRERLEPARMEFLEVIGSEEGKDRMQAAFEQRLSR